MQRSRQTSFSVKIPRLAKNWPNLPTQKPQEEESNQCSLPLYHFIFIYREEIGLAISDLVICKYASEQLEKSEENPPVCTNFTHRDGKNYFNLQRDADFKHLPLVERCHALSRFWLIHKERGKTLMLQYQETRHEKRNFHQTRRTAQNTLKNTKRKLWSFSFRKNSARLANGKLFNACKRKWTNFLNPTLKPPSKWKRNTNKFSMKLLRRMRRARRIRRMRRENKKGKICCFVFLRLLLVD